MDLLDLAIILILIIFAARGLGRGFVTGTLELAGLVLTFAVAFSLYRPLGSRALGLVPALTPSSARLVAFLVLAAGTVVAWSVISSRLLGGERVMRAWTAPGFDGLLGALTGLLLGIAVVTAVLVVVRLYPADGALSRQLEHSRLYPRFEPLAGAATRRVEPLLALVPRKPLFGATPAEERPVRLHFPSDLRLTVDRRGEEEMLKLINRDRRERGLRPLVMDPRLRAIAREHSREMFELGYFGHDSPRTGTPGDRLRAAHIAFLVAGENVAYEPDVPTAHRALMASPGHRRNILSPPFERVGIGIVRSELYGEMITQDFAGRA